MTVQGAKPSGGVTAGVLGGFALLLFAGALVATSQLPGQADEATTALRGRKLADFSIQNTGATVAVTTPSGAVVPAVGTPVTDEQGIIQDAKPGVGKTGETTMAEISAWANSATTTMTVAQPAGSFAIAVVDTSIFVIGQFVQLDYGQFAEVRHIKSIETATHELTFHRGLLFAHAVGATVVLQEESLRQQSMHQSSSGPLGSLKSSAEKDSGSGSSSSSIDSFKSSESGSSAGQLLKAEVWASSAMTGGCGLLNIALLLCYACLYKSKVVDPMGIMQHQALQHEQHNDFRYGVFDCFKDVNMCCMVMFCPLVRMAHTNETADVCGFWESIVCLACSSLCICGPLCMQVYFRIHIKDHMGIADHCFNDFCVAFFCLPCVTGQQALAVDETMGWKFKCPCNIEHVSASGGYGQTGY